MAVQNLCAALAGVSQIESEPFLESLGGIPQRERSSDALAAVASASSAVGLPGGGVVTTRH